MWAHGVEETACQNTGSMPPRQSAAADTITISSRRVLQTWRFDLWSVLMTADRRRKTRHNQQIS
jgi:hypothetical protein